MPEHNRWSLNSTSNCALGHAEAKGDNAGTAKTKVHTHGKDLREGTTLARLETSLVLILKTPKTFVRAGVVLCVILSHMLGTQMVGFTDQSQKLCLVTMKPLHLQGQDLGNNMVH